MDFLRGCSVLVLGLGASGLAMARWCVRHGAQVQVWDSRAAPPHAAELHAELPQVRLFTGELGTTLPEGVRLLLKSPGLAPHDARIAPLLAAARASGIAVMAELDLFMRALADLKTHAAAEVPQLLAITGTNGKTTTTALTALLVARAGRRVAVAGNIMPSLLERLAQMLDAPRAEWPEVWVLELSSFQLADAADFEPTAGAVLNLTQDHLDWHGDMAAYGAAKARVFGRQATMVVNRDDAAVEAMVPAPPAVKGVRGKPPPAPRAVLRFGLTAPERPGDFGLVVENGMAWLVRALPADELLARKRDDTPPEIHLQRLMPAEALRLRGRHNAANALAALALASASGCALAPMLHGLREYGGQPHRVQWLGQVGDVAVYDDSKGTNVGATVAALEGLAAEHAPGRLVVILGGQGKGQDFAPLAVPLSRHARAVALLGQDAPAIAAAIAGCGVPMAQHATLPEAVAWGFAQARSGDALLLSPACASLDMFRDYAHRAEVFAQAVRDFAADRGEVL
ncbi:MAG: UDP-N-acetylmuramoyl-L-alanine--D-glutamate ligase [Rubrivivax sp. SCN 71-131]|nr:MAG: UDP-N-acetylmuramoyl-L-alanine--D-glutamate ligase [Rubrivivax sp. SCN 71-131]